MRSHDLVGYVSAIADLVADLVGRSRLGSIKSVSIVTFFCGAGIMLQTNDIANFFKELFWALFHRMISRKFLDSMTIWYVIQKVSGYHRRI